MKFIKAVFEGLRAALKIFICPSKDSFNEMTHDESAKDPQ